MEARPKLIKRSQQGELVLARYEGKNESGFDPIDETVLILPDGVAEETSGGITLLPEYIERMSLAAETGVIIAVAEGAFRWNASKSRPWQGERPKPGDRVYMRRYAGQVMLGDDERLYRLISDHEIGAIQRPSEKHFLAADTAPIVYAPIKEVVSYSEVEAALNKTESAQ